MGEKKRGFVAKPDNLYVQKKRNESDSSMKNKKREDAIVLPCEPQAGIEPATFSLRVKRSTD